MLVVGVSGSVWPLGFCIFGETESSTQWAKARAEKLSTTWLGGRPSSSHCCKCLKAPQTDPPSCEAPTCSPNWSRTPPSLQLPRRCQENLTGTGLQRKTPGDFRFWVSVLQAPLPAARYRSGWAQTPHLVTSVEVFRAPDC